MVKKIEQMMWRSIDASGRLSPDASTVPHKYIAINLVIHRGNSVQDIEKHLILFLRRIKSAVEVAISVITNPFFFL